MFRAVGSHKFLTYSNQQLATEPPSRASGCYSVLQGLFRARFITAFLAAIRVFFRSRVDTSLEVLALRQQVAVLKRKGPRPAMTRFDRFFWTALRQLWSRWPDTLIIVKAETVVAWHLGRVFACTGVGDPGRVAGDQRSARSFKLSSAPWRLKIQAGAHQRSTGNC
jgi:hypothetical protein